MRVGYARVSTAEQSTQAQQDALKAAACAKVFEDQVSGVAAQRPGLAAAFGHLRKDDTLVVWKIDRLGRSIRELIDLVSRLDDMGVHFVSLTEGFDTATPGGRMIFHVLGALAQFERDLIRERTRAGLDAAWARGRRGGRPRRLSPEQLVAARAMIADGQSVAHVARVLSVPYSTAHDALIRAPVNTAPAAVVEADG